MHVSISRSRLRLISNIIIYYNLFKALHPTTGADNKLKRLSWSGSERQKNVDDDVCKAGPRKDVKRFNFFLVLIILLTSARLSILFRLRTISGSVTLFA